LTRLGWLSRHALSSAWSRVSGSPNGDGPDGPDDSDGERPAAGQPSDDRDDATAVATEVLGTLGSMKGLALKIGQVLSYMDGVVPAHRQPAFQRVLAPLLQAAPSMPWAAIEPVLVAELGAPLSRRFAELEPEPFAAASIGQVHRGRLTTGEEVAVKVQYPGIEKAMRADLGNLSFLRSVASPLLGLVGRGAIGKEMKAILAELSARLLEELDYTHEAALQERFRALLAPDPVVGVPRVFTDHSTRRVLTTELVRGRSFEEMLAHASQDERNHYAVGLSRAVFRCIFGFHLINGDPHPGNYLFHDDGRITLLDFGCVKELPEWVVASMLRYTRAATIATRSGRREDWDDYDRAIVDAFKLDPHDPGFSLYREFTLYCLRPYIVDEPFTFTPAYTAGSVDAVLSGARDLFFAKGKWPRLPTMPPLPADFTFIGRLQWGFYSILTRMNASANFHRTLPAHVLAAITPTASSG
jgi:hypothetical protein